jgi:phenylalanyl-tRNA synthetase beta chain
MDIWDLKHHFELAVQTAAPGALVRAAADGAGWEAAGPDGAVVGRAVPLDADAPVWAGPLFGFEVVIDAAERPVVPYRAIPQIPAVERDLALVLPAGVGVDQVEAVWRRAAGALLERLEVFDEYRGAGLPAGARSVAWHCTFRDPRRTLRETEVDRQLDGVLRALEGELDVRRRES